ncbi:hypothetical protein [Priestia koreensis]|uniref:Uncharacterized protein n=1 Tax=Priestia koreensis TaxID=284581 RepID=A0A0M0L7Q3_9BACI|nr:hypothetical protein [Priestia koreensis]KOO47105.1 hypothetical protein AMD01_07055 [Priestia koreensis]
MLIKKRKSRNTGNNSLLQKPSINVGIVVLEAEKYQLVKQTITLVKKILGTTTVLIVTEVTGG